MLYLYIKSYWGIVIASNIVVIYYVYHMALFNFVTMPPNCWPHPLINGRPMLVDTW